jgi:hypothetical protein
MFGRFHRLCGEIAFHPASHRAPDLEGLLTDTLGDD